MVRLTPNMKYSKQKFQHPHLWVSSEQDFTCLWLLVWNRSWKGKTTTRLRLMMVKAAITQTQHGESDHLCSVGKKTHGSFTYVRSATLNTMNHILIASWKRVTGTRLTFNHRFPVMNHSSVKNHKHSQSRTAFAFTHAFSKYDAYRDRELRLVVLPLSTLLLSRT